jgi:hypothetical protein
MARTLLWANDRGEFNLTRQEADKRVALVRERVADDCARLLREFLRGLAAPGRGRFRVGRQHFN